jgi:hypothetical protein
MSLAEQAPGDVRAIGIGGPCVGHSVETELVALDVLHHHARLVVVIGSQ